MKMFVIYDSKIEAYDLPMTFKARGEAIRVFADAINADEPKAMIARYPSDYTLFEIADYCDATGVITPYPAMVNLGIGHEFKQS